MTEKLCVFISYKRQDQPFAERLWEILHAWGCETWLDVKNIPSGISEESTGWIDAIHKGLKRSHVLIGVVTPESLQSERVKEEWFWAKLANRRILFLRLNPFDVEEMPPPFATANYIDLVDDERRGFEQLRSVLQEVQRQRDEFKAEITPPAQTALVAQPPTAIAPYLLGKSARRRYVPWRITLRAVGILALPVSFLWLLTQPDFEPLLAFLGAIGSTLASFVGTDSEDTELSRSSKLTDVEQMRKRVYQYWVQGVMQTALKEVESVGIALDMQPEAVVRDTRKNVGDIALPNDSRHVRQVYDIFKSFLILGDPGAGKTILLLQLAESLILNPPPTHADAIPLVLNLSSWALHPRPLHEWLEDEVWRTYRVRGNRVKGWLTNNQLILLLDGLDEVKEERRAACVEAINAFRGAYVYVPLVVCSRIKDYERLGETKLKLTGAILLEALSQAQIDHYLSDISLMHLKRVMAEDSVLQEMATTPFLLNTMIYAYRHEPEDAIRGFESEAQRREHLFNTYVMRRLKDQPSPYGYQQTIAYLQWLATKMQAYVQTVFHLEDIQPNWVADDAGFQPTVNVLRAAYAVILTLVYALVGWQMGEWIGLLAWGAAGGLVGAGIASVQHFRLKAREKINLHFDLDDEDNKLLIYLIAASGLGLILMQMGTAFMSETLALMLVSAAAGVLMFLLFARDSADNWKDTLLKIALCIVGALWVGGIVWSIAHMLSWSIWIEAVIVAFLVIGVLLHFALFEEQSVTVLPHRRTTLRRILLVSLLMGGMFGVIGVLFNLGATPGIAAVLTYAGLFNGITLVYLPVLWLRLYRRASLPIRTGNFLDALAERQILRRMGGGYIFIHRYLLENFARLDEIYILLEQLKDETRRKTAQEHLKRLLDNAPVTTQRELKTALAWDNPAVHPLQRHYGIQLLREHGIELEDNRPGVGLRPDGLPQIEWCDIPAPPDGVFIMGADDRENNPRREVELNYSFKMSKYLITSQQFQTFIDSGEFDAPQWWEGFPKAYHPQKMDNQNNPYDNHPRDRVSWYQAVAFARWIDAKYREAGLIGEGVEIRLPMEQEWEYAARGTDERRYPYQGAFDATKGNTNETGIGQTSAVGLFADGASPFGVLDMAGNLWEWCLNDYGSPDIITGFGNGKSKVLRGGSFSLDQDACRRVGSQRWPSVLRWQPLRVAVGVVCPLLARSKLWISELWISGALLFSKGGGGGFPPPLPAKRVATKFCKIAYISITGFGQSGCRAGAAGRFVQQQSE